MSDQMRKDFEAAYDSGQIDALERISPVQFESFRKHCAWAAWQAARRAEPERMSEQVLFALTMAKKALGGECDVKDCDMCIAYRAVEAALNGAEPEQAAPVGYFSGEFSFQDGVPKFVCIAYGALPEAGAKLYAAPQQEQK